MINYASLVIGSFVVTLAATHLQGLTLKNYALYMLAQAVGTALFLSVNKHMTPFQFTVAVTALINVLATLVVYFEGIAPLTPYSIGGMILITGGTVLLFVK